MILGLTIDVYSFKNHFVISVIVFFFFINLAYVFILKFFLLKIIYFHILNSLFFHSLLTYYLFLKFFNGIKNIKLIYSEC